MDKAKSYLAKQAQWESLIMNLCCCGNQVLKAERPDVDEKRSDLLKLQGMLLGYVHL